MIEEINPWPCLRVKCTEPALEGRGHCLEHSRCKVHGCVEDRLEDGDMCRGCLTRWSKMRDKLKQRFLEGRA